MFLSAALVAVMLQAAPSTPADPEKGRAPEVNRTATAGTSLDRSGEFAVVDVWTKHGDAWKLSARLFSRPDTLKR